MNAKTAKALRRRIYGEQSLRVERKYLRNETTGQWINHPDSLRAIYQRAKKMQTG